MEPLKERVVDSELDIRVSGVQSQLEFTQNIPLGSDVNRVPAESEAGWPVGEALVVLAREHQIPVEQVELLALEGTKLSLMNDKYLIFMILTPGKRPGRSCDHP